MPVFEYPVLPVNLPADLKRAPNGRLADNLLVPLKGYPRGRMHRKAATGFNCLQLAAFFAGIELKPTSPNDCYRDYAKQKAMFDRRYRLEPTGRNPQVTRKFDGKTYYLLPKVAPSASPGTSNHGLGLAVDISGATGARLAWMLGDLSKPYGTGCPVIQFGFSWEVKSGPNAESWHIRWVCGDNYPPAVIDALRVFPDLEA